MDDPNKPQDTNPSTSSGPMATVPTEPVQVPTPEPAPTSPPAAAPTQPLAESAEEQKLLEELKQMQNAEQQEVASDAHAIDVREEEGKALEKEEQNPQSALQGAPEAA